MYLEWEELPEAIGLSSGLFLITAFMPAQIYRMMNTCPKTVGTLKGLNTRIRYMTTHGHDLREIK